MFSFRPMSAVFISVFIILISACDQAEPPPSPPPPAVEVQAVMVQPVSSEFEFVARTRAREDTEIRARITGTIIERNFSEGQEVEKDDLLFRIDPRPYQTALNAAKAELARANSARKVAERNLERGKDLKPQGFISEAELDKLRDERERAIAAEKSAAANIEQANLNLEFTEIRAPFTGRAGRSNLSIGDLVDPSSGALVSLVQNDPMLVDFDVNERSLAESMNNNQQRAREGLDPISYTPRLRLVNGDFYPLEGSINYANNRVNPSTGTVTVTASFPNPDGVLIPGQFGRIIVKRGDPELRMLIAQSSVLEDMQGRFVYIVGNDSLVIRKNVKLGPKYGVNWVVEEGLSEGDRVIVNGVQKVRPNMPAVPSPVDTEPFDETRQD
jgi:membrane fusion protein (multidrug efflux system)